MKGGATSLTFGNGGTRAKGGTMIIKGGLRTLDETMVPSPRMPCFARIRRLAVLGTQFFAQFCHFLSFFGLKFSFFFIFFEKNVSFLFIFF